MPDISAGSVSVEVVPDARGFREKLAAQLRDAQVEVRLDLDQSSVDEANAELDRVARDRTAVVRVRTEGLQEAERGAGLLASSLMALGPATVPLTAAAVPALASLAAQAGYAVIALGTMKLAFQGVGEAVKAFNKASLEPTAKNIAAAQQAFDKISPAAQAFVVQLHDMAPILDRLKRDSSGVFYGLANGLEQAQGALPPLERLLQGVSREMGAIAQSAGGALGSERWRPFLDMLGTEAPRALADMSRGAGAVAHGLAEMWMAFEPSNANVLAGMASAAEDFDRWASHLSQTNGFHDFIAYLDSTGPQVLHTLGDFANLLIDIGKAAAPLGGPTLTALDDIAKVLDAIASTPLGTVGIAMIQLNGVMSLTNKALAGMGASAAIGFGGIKTGVAESGGALATLRAEAGATGSALRTMWGNIGRNAANGTPLLTGVKPGAFGGALKAGAAGVGIGLVASGAASDIGLANTAMLAMAGSMAGPFGTAAGATVGLMMDMSSAGKSVTQAIKDADAAMKANASGGLVDMQQKLDALTAARDSFYSDSSFGGLLKSGLSGASDLFNHGDASYTLNKSAADQAALQQAMQQQRAVSESIGLAMNKNLFTSPTGMSIAPSLDQLDAIAQRAAPAMQALHMSMADLENMDPSQLQAAGVAIANWTKNADSAKGRTKAVRDAFANLGNTMSDTATEASTLHDALNAVISPNVNLIETQDALTTSLRGLGKELSTSNHSLNGNTDAAIKNRAAVDQRVNAITAMISAEADAGQKSQKIQGDLLRERNALIQAGVAAGISKKQMRDYLDTLGLTPALVSTLIKADTSPAEAALSAFQARLAGMKDAYIRVHTVFDGGSGRPPIGSSLPHYTAPPAAPGPVGSTATPSSSGGSHTPGVAPRGRMALILDTGESFNGHVATIADGRINNANDFAATHGGRHP